jgi:hypothetical protein
MKTLIPSLIHESRSAALALLCLMGVAAQAGESGRDAQIMDLPVVADPWKFKLAVPGWLAATSGTIGVNGVNSQVYLGADTLIQKLDMVASLSAEARKGRFGFYGDLLYVSASDGIGGEGLLQKVDIRLDQYILDLELNYRVLEGPGGFLDVRGGVRYTNLYNKVTISPNDTEIDRASTNLVDDIGELVRDSLNDLDLRGVLEERISGRLAGLNGKRPSLPIAPLGGREPDRLDELVRAIIEKRAKSLAAALRAVAEATTDALREEARRRIDDTKREIADEIATKLKTELDKSFILAEDWWDPYVGVRARLNLSTAFYLAAKADIGGFGIGSDLTWQASGALGCQLTRSIHAELGYRYLYTDYNKDGFLYEVSQSGLEITVGINF